MKMKMSALLFWVQVSLAAQTPHMGFGFGSNGFESCLWGKQTAGNQVVALASSLEDQMHIKRSAQLTDFGLRFFRENADREGAEAGDSPENRETSFRPAIAEE